METPKHALRNIENLKSGLCAQYPKKRQASRAALRNIYRSSTWFSARYSAGVALAVNENDLNQQLDGWLKELLKEMCLPISKSVYVGERPTGRCVVADYVGKRWEDEMAPAYEEREISDNRERVEKAIEDAGKLYRLSNSKQAWHLLRVAYAKGVDKTFKCASKLSDFRNPTQRRELDELENYRLFHDDTFEISRRENAGKALGYSKLRRWAHENPDALILALSIGAPAALVAYGLVNAYLK